MPNSGILSLANHTRKNDHGQAWGVNMQVFGREPLDRQAARIPRGQVFVILERCKGCQFCIRFCPAAVLQSAHATNSKGYHVPEIAPGKEQACIHCQFCSLVCPEFAIFSTEGEQ